MRDLSGTSGTGGSFFMERDFMPGITIRTRFDYLSFKEGPAKATGLLPSLVPPTALRVASNQASIGAEMRAHPVAGLLKDLFVLGGVSGTRAEFVTLNPSGQLDANGKPLPGLVRFKDKTPVKVGLSAGLGFQFCHASAVTVRYATANLGGVTLATLEGGLEVRF